MMVFEDAVTVTVSCTCILHNRIKYFSWLTSSLSPVSISFKIPPTTSKHYTTPSMPPPIPPSQLHHHLSKCTTLLDLANGTSLHSIIIKMGSFHTDNFLGNLIVNFYAKCEQWRDSNNAFDEIMNKDVGSWNCLVNAYSHCHTHLVLCLFRRMMRDLSVLPNSFTFTGVFTAVGKELCVGGGKEVHCAAVKMDCVSGDVFAESAMISMYQKLGLVMDARKVFDRMRVRNSVTWAAMISCYSDEDDGSEAFELFKLCLKEEGSSCINEFVLTSVLSVVSVVGSLRMGEQVQGYTVKNGYFSFVAVKNSIVTTYTKCGLLDYACRVFFESSSNRNSITWGAMITGYAQNGRPLKALELFSHMHVEGVMSSEYIFVGVLNACSHIGALTEGKQIHAYLLKLGFESHLYVKSSMVDMYAKCGVIRDAWKGFNQVLEADTVIWTTMISGFVQNAENEEGLSLYCRMGVEGVPPNDLTLTSTLRACSCLGALELGKQLHGHAIKYGLNLKNPIGSALMTMYAKGGDPGQSLFVFRKMKTKDVIAWNSMISAFAQNGYGDRALELFDGMIMESVAPNDITFINLLSACSHMGLVDRGWNYFTSMSVSYGLNPKVEHYACMVDILSRAGLLDEAKIFIESALVDDRACLWRILLGACMNHRRLDLGAYAGERLMELGTTDSSAYILLSNIYAASGRREGIERVRQMMTSRGVNKEPGCSWIEIGNRVHVFLVRELQHPATMEIYRELRRLNKHMKDRFS